jgi:hypothetical protein
MLVSATRYADLFARVGASAQNRQAPALPSHRDNAEPEERPAHFSMISTISPGSLAAAYQVIRAREGDAAAPAPAGESAILSGLGVPSALTAYGEVLETD